MMPSQQNPDDVTLEISGHSDPIEMMEGRWDIELFATTWDDGNPVGLEFANDNIEDRFVSLADPAADYSNVARIANGPHIVLEHGGGFIRMSAPTIGTTTGLTLSGRYIGP